MKKVISAVVVCMMLFIGSANTFALAADGGTITPQWENTSSIVMNMNYTDGQVKWAGKISGNPDVVSISASYKLERRKANGTYTLVSSWGPFSTTTATYLYNFGAVTTSSGTYKLTVTGTVTSSSGYAESITDSLEKYI